MVAHCRAQGLVAVQRDFLHLDLGRQFDAVFAMNCLLHVRAKTFPPCSHPSDRRSRPVVSSTSASTAGIDQDGDLADDSYEPKRYFSLLTDDDLLAVAGSISRSNRSAP